MQHTWKYATKVLCYLRFSVFSLCSAGPPSLVTKGYIPAGEENGIANPTVLPSNGFAGSAKKLRLAVTSLKYISRLLCSIVHTLFFPSQACAAQALPARTCL